MWFHHTMVRRKKKNKGKQKKDRKQHYIIRTKKTRDLLVIDNKPIRRKAVTNCSRILKTYKSLKQEIAQFEQTDKPLFRQWFNASFGAQLTEIRELQKEADELEDFVHLVHFIKYSRGISFHRAYILAEELKKNPEKIKAEYNDFTSDDSWYDFSDADDPDDDEEEFPGEDGEDDEDFIWEEDDEDFSEDMDNEKEGGEEWSDKMIEELFIQAISGFPGSEKILEDPSLFAQLFKEFKESFFHKKNEGETANSRNQDTWDSHEGVHTRIKTLYRSLAMKLHPDNNNSQDTLSIERWYNVQEAYRQNNLEELEKLNALQHFEEGSFSPDCPVSQILALHVDYKEQLKILRRSIRRSKDDLAWNFSKRKEKKDLHASIKEDLSSTLREELIRKSYLETMITKWKESPAPGKSKGRRGNWKKFVPPPEQLELPF
jgi:hypothetical protein